MTDEFLKAAEIEANTPVTIGPARSQAIRDERRNGELLGPLISQYGAAAVVEAMGVMQLASDMGVIEPLDHCQTCGTPIGCGTCQGCVAYSAVVAQEDYPEEDADDF